MPAETSKSSNLSNHQAQIDSLNQKIEHLEEKLLESEHNFLALTDNAPVGIYLNNPEGEAVYINNKCAELVGVPAETALQLNWIDYLHPDDSEHMVAAWQKAFSESTEFHEEYRWVHQDGKIIWTLGEVVPILDEQDNAKMFIGTLTDITAQKEAELERELLKEELEKAHKMESIGRLAGGVAHDFNNMLGAIIGYSELAMRDVKESDPLHHKLEQILKAANRSADITKQLLNFARKNIAKPIVIELNTALSEMHGMLKPLIGENIQLELKPYHEDIHIEMDPAQLDQIIVNLCINARDAIDNIGKIVINVSIVEEVPALANENISPVFGQHVLLTIQDNGNGIEKDDLDNIFEPFFTTKHDKLGTGLGLASVYGIVKQSKGYISVSSKPEQGTTFSIYIPITSGQRLAPCLVNFSQSEVSTGVTVLVVEDEIAILEIVRVNLEALGYKVIAANSPTEAINLAKGYVEKISLLITDIIMPEMNGKELADKLARDNPHLKSIFMSGYSAEIISQKGLLNKGTRFIQKPFNANALLAEVQLALS